MAKKENKEQENIQNNDINGEEMEMNKAKSTSKKKTRKEDKIENQLEEAKAEIAALNDKYLRLFSEFDNYRKRTLKERTELLKTASEDVIVRLLPVIDDFERAMKAYEDTDEKNGDTLDQGVKLVFNKLKGILEQKGLEPIEAIGEVFDVEYHEAMTNIPAPSEDMKGKVVDEIEKGYKLGDKVIRYSKVIVGQ